jgi:hypothetical protein
MRPVEPPRVLEWLLTRCLAADGRGRSILGDLRESLSAVHPAGGWRAYLWYAREVFIVALQYGPERAVAAVRHSRRRMHFSGFGQDVRFALRASRRQPGPVVGRDADAGDRHRRDHGGVQRCQWAPAPTVAGGRTSASRGRIGGAAWSGNYFEVLGVRPARVVPIIVAPIHRRFHSTAWAARLPGM